MFAIRPRFIAVMLHSVYALGLLGFLVAVVSLSIGRLPTLVVGELFLLPWTLGFLALWWHLLKRSGMGEGLVSPRHKLANGVVLGLAIIIITGSFFYLGPLVGISMMVLATLAGAVIAVRQLAIQRKAGMWWPTTSTGVWIGIVAGLYAISVLIASAAPNLR